MGRGQAMFLYKNTPLEVWVENLYRSWGITSPLDLNIKNLARKLDIWIYYHENSSQALEYNGMWSVILDSRMAQQEQWEDFLHEVGHILRHYGNQSIMPETLVQLQEDQVKHFQLYATMPYYLIREMELPSYEQDVINLLSSRFNVTLKLAKIRLEQIKRRDFQVRSDQEFIKNLNGQYRNYDPLDTSRWSSETSRIMNQLYKQIGKGAPA